MKIALAVYGAPHLSHAPASAWHFATAAIHQSHKIVRVFFYGDGTYIAHPQYSQNDFNNLDSHQQWIVLAHTQQIELAICRTSAMRRGLGEDIPPPFVLCGLGQLIDAGLVADRFIAFHTA